MKPKKKCNKKFGLWKGRNLEKPKYVKHIQCS